MGSEIHSSRTMQRLAGWLAGVLAYCCSAIEFYCGGEEHGQEGSVENEDCFVNEWGKLHRRIYRPNQDDLL